PTVQHAFDAKQTARFFAFASVSACFEGRRMDVYAAEILWPNVDARQPKTEFLRRERLEAVAVAECAIECVVVSPCQRPIVAALCGATNGFLWRPLDASDGATGRQQCRFRFCLNVISLVRDGSDQRLE